MNARDNGSIPSWAKALSDDLRAFVHEAREDRKQAAEDRRAFAEYCRRADKESAERHQEFLDTLGLLVRVTAATSRATAQMAREQKNQTALLHDILRTLRVTGNGHGGNGRAGSNGRRPRA